MIGILVTTVYIELLGRGGVGIVFYNCMIG